MTVDLPVFVRGRYVATTTVDADVAEKLRGVVLSLSGDGYPRVRGLPVHRFVTGCATNDGKVVHHIDEDKLNNTRANLVVCDGPSEANRMPHPKRDATVRDAARLRCVEQPARTAAA